MPVSLSERHNLIRSALDLSAKAQTIAVLLAHEGSEIQANGEAITLKNNAAAFQARLAEDTTD